MLRHRPGLRVSTAVLLLAIVLSASTAAAQPSEKSAVAVRTRTAPNIDGRMNEPLWAQAKVIEDFTQLRPTPGAAASERTRVYIVYDDDAIYVGAQMLRVDPSSVPQMMSRRDGQANAEKITVVFDPQLDRRTGVGFGVSAAGVRSDFRHTQDEEMRGRESQFDPVWMAAAEVDSAGWTAEMRIPFSQLRFPSRDVQRWGLQVNRWIPDRNEDLFWVMIPPSETGYVSRFGTLEGIEGVQAARPVEFLPYAAGDATRRASTAVENPLARPYTSRAGLDAKAAVGSGLTLDVTINPDFGQVEADPAEVNLSAFETFFDERRPFFTEGSEMLRGNGAQYFYARRIGAPPRVSVSGDFVDTPSSSTILGAAKLTGRLPSRLTIGALTAITAAERARVYDLDSASTSSFAVEPRTAYGVLRLQQEVGTQASTLGISMSAVNRDVSREPVLAARMAREAYFAGADWRLRFQQGKYAISGFIAGSQVAGDTAAIRRLQTSSVRFFQRPDLKHVRYDPTRTSLSGYSAQLRADKDAGKTFLWGAEVKAESPGFEVNDLGRMQSTDDLEYNADLQVRETVPGKYLQNWRLGFETRGSRNYGGVHQQNSWTQNTSVTFKNLWNFNVRSTWELPATDDALTRGGPLMGKVANERREFRLSNPFGSRTPWRITAGNGTDALGGSQRSVGGQLTLRTTDRVSMSIEPSWQEGLEPRQYITSRSGGTRTFGQRYIFGRIDRTTISLKLRANLTFSPNLTLEGYAEPFVASGRFSRVGELVAPRSAQLREYGTDGTTLTVDSAGTMTIVDGADSFTLASRDFHVLSFRQNLVMRWEWQPGSTLFLVWQQNRRTSETFGDPVRFDELFRTTRAAGDNFLSIKASFWVPVVLGGKR
ncbi:MAG: DUF5916 domain-containing protein [Gemmatimonadaceae bacterium]